MKGLFTFDTYLHVSVASISVWLQLTDIAILYYDAPTAGNA